MNGSNGKDVVSGDAGAQKFRSNVGIMIVNRDGRILAGDAFHYPGEWMMPQGGIDAAELTEAAMRRGIGSSGTHTVS